MIHLYKPYIWSILEQSCGVWGSSITEEYSRTLERVQQVALRIIYLSSYNHALSISGLSKLSERRDTLSYRFAVRSKIFYQDEQCVSKDECLVSKPVQPVV